MNEKILILSNASGFGGAERALILLIRQFLLDSNQVEVVVQNARFVSMLEKFQIEFGKHIKINELGNNNQRIHLLVELKRIYHIITKEKFDKILVNTNKAAFCLAILWPFLNYRSDQVIIYVRDFQWKMKGFIVSQLKKCHFAIPSEALKQQMEKYVPTSMISVTGDPFLIAEHEDANEKKCDYILVLATLSRWKGIDYLLKAFSLTDYRHENISLKICGDKAPGKDGEKYYGELISIINERNLQEYVEILPFQNDVNTLYRNCIFVVNSSISEFGGPETFGLTLLEAWSHNKPVISFAVGGPKYLIEHGVDGLLVREKDIEALSKAMNLLINNIEQVRTMGRKGFEKANQKFTPKLVVERLYRMWGEGTIEKTFDTNVYRKKDISPASSIGEIK